MWAQLLLLANGSIQIPFWVSSFNNLFIFGILKVFLLGISNIWFILVFLLVSNFTGSTKNVLSLIFCPSNDLNNFSSKTSLIVIALILWEYFFTHSSTFSKMSTSNSLALIHKFSSEALYLSVYPLSGRYTTSSHTIESNNIPASYEKSIILSSSKLNSISLITETSK